MPPNRRYVAFSMFLVLVQLYKLFMRNQQCQVCLLSSELLHSNSDDELAFVLSVVKRKKGRSAWMFARSTEWVRLLIRGKDTKGRPMAAGIFEKSFRMTRNSFEQLHAVLGISGILKSSDFELEPYIALQDTDYRPLTMTRAISEYCRSRNTPLYKPY